MDIVEAHLRVEDDLGDGYVRLRISEAERRQAAHDIRSSEDVVIELLRNARDAGAHSVFLAVTRDGQRRRVVAIDDGEGVPPALHERIFEPRVTSKLDTMHVDSWGVHGRGMALYSIAVNAEVARVVASDKGMGASILVETDLGKVGEKADQSSFPRFERTESGSVSVRGPRNILRTACEFALDAHRSCTLYLGSVTEIAATLYAFGLTSLTTSLRVFCRDSSELPVCKRLAVANDPDELAHEAAGLGLELSSRSARRIMDGQIAPLSPLLDRVRIEGEEKASSAKPLSPIPADRRPLKISPDDLEAFEGAVRQGFSELARAYYLEADVEVEVRVGKDAIHVSVPVRRL